MTQHSPSSATLAIFAVSSTGLVTIAVTLGKSAFGTHRLLIHATALVLAMGYYVLLRREGIADPLQSLGIRPLKLSVRAWPLVVLGLATGIARFVFYQFTGLGGLRLYESEFTTKISGDSLPELILRCCVFAPILYLAVLIPGLLFCGVIQGTMARSGWWIGGLLLQAVTFGYVHCYMTTEFDAVYGVEAFVGGLIYGVAFQVFKTLYLPALFMATNVFTATLLLALR